LRDTVRFLKDHGTHVIYDAEHAFDGCKDWTSDYAMATWQAAEARRGGHDRHAVRHERRLRCRPRLATSCGWPPAASPAGAARHPYARRHRARRRQFALAAVAKSAPRRCKGTINGYGERTGNCNITSVMP
jgi:2-isopropylmalate synthase